MQRLVVYVKLVVIRFPLWYILMEQDEYNSPTKQPAAMDPSDVGVINST